MFGVQQVSMFHTNTCNYTESSHFLKYSTCQCPCCIYC